jgi:hypothetical protein
MAGREFECKYKQHTIASASKRQKLISHTLDCTSAICC